MTEEKLAEDLEEVFNNMPKEEREAWSKKADEVLSRCDALLKKVDQND